jgi:flagellar hook-associated protein 1 FlgK
VSGDSVKIGSVTFTAGSGGISGTTLATEFAAYLSNGTQPSVTDGLFTNSYVGGTSHDIAGWTGTPTDNGSGTLTLSATGLGTTADLGAGTVMYSGKATVSAITANTTTQPGTYQLSSAGGNLTLSANINGSPISQTIALANIAANSSQTINFGNLGISLTVNNGNTQLTAQTLALQLAGSSPTNQISIAPGIDTGLDLATSLNNQTFSVTGQTNSALTYGLTAENFVSLAPSDPSGYMNGTTPYISSAAANAVSSMNSVFGNAVANLVSDVGTKVATWKNNQTANTAVLNNLQSQSSSISGVNLDEEAANLLKYQQLYSASSKVLQVGNQMFTTLLGIMN